MRVVEVSLEGPGVVSLRIAGRHLEEMTGDLTLIYRAMSDDDLIFQPELHLLARRGIRVHYVVGDHRLPEHRHLLSVPHLRHLVPEIAECDVYLCGQRLHYRS